MAKKRQKWEIGDIFTVPLKNNEYGLGQIIEYEKQALGSVVCTFSNTKLLEVPEAKIDFLDETSIISVQFVTPDLLDIGEWRTIGHMNPPSVKKYMDIRRLRKKDFIGAKVYGSKILYHFLNAYHKLDAWDMMHDIEYFDKMLLPNVERPSDLIFEKSEGV